MTVLEVIARGIVGIVIVKAAAVENRHHEADSQGVRECDTEDERYDSACPHAGEAAKNTGSSQSQNREKGRPANNVEQPKSRRFDTVAGLGRNDIGLAVTGIDGHNE
jgi:hypothetical protein